MTEPKILTMEKLDTGVGILTFDAPNTPMNTISDQATLELAEWIDQAEKDKDLKAVALLGKSTNFIAGADISEIQKITKIEEAVQLSARLQGLLNRLEALDKPVIAAIHGPALGGGLELAMACHYRIVSSADATVLGLPEVKLGLLPGAGGTQRLMRLIPLQDAMEAVLTGKNIRPREALKLGLADELALPYRIRETAIERATQIARGEFVIKRKSPPMPPAKMLPALYEQAKARIAKEARGIFPAPMEILESMYKGLTDGMKAGLDEESKRFGTVVMSKEASSLIHVFFSERGSKKDMGPAAGVKPKPVAKIGVLGAGIMGHGIAAVKADAGYLVRMKDRDLGAVSAGLKAASDVLRKTWIKRPRGEFEYRRRMDLISASPDYSGFEKADVCIEAVYEDIDLKHRVIKEVEEVLPDHAIFASNTSAIPITRLAEASKRKEQFLGMHYFSPVHKMPLIEIIVTKDTSKEALATACMLCAKTKKTPIIVNDGAGFFTSRVISRYIQEAMFMLDEGARIEDIDASAVKVGFPVGPVTVSDEVGLDTAAKVGHVLLEVFQNRFSPSPLLDKLAEAGRMGRKNGLGFYEYGDGKKKGPDASSYALTAQGAERVSLTPDEISNRLLLAFCLESALCLEEDILRNPRDGDIGGIMGIGFPPNLGGPFHYMQTRGIAAVADDLAKLEERFGGRFQVPQILKDMAGSGKVFFP